MLSLPHREDGGAVLAYDFIFCAVRKYRVGASRKMGVLGGNAPAQAANKRRMDGNVVDVHRLCLLVSRTGDFVENTDRDFPSGFHAEE